MGRNKKPQVRRLNGWGQAPPGEPVWEENTAAVPAEADLDESAPNGWEVTAQSKFSCEAGGGIDLDKKNKPWRRKECSFCTLCCSVPPGFEREAGEELREVFDRRSTFDRRTQFVTVPVNRIEDVNKANALRSADKVSVKASTLEGFLSRGDQDVMESLNQIQEAALWVDWGTALETWAKFSGKYSGSPFDFCEEYASKPPTFRVECSISSKSDRQSFGCVNAEEYFAAGVKTHFGWCENKSHSSDVIIGLVVCDRDVTVVIELKKWVACESLPGTYGGLRLAPTLAHVLLRLAKIRPGEIVLDPMCGSCAIGIEGAFAWPTAWHVSGDKYIQPIWQTQKKSHRLDAVMQMDNVEWNAKRLPLREGSVDAIITDLPCGQQLPKGEKKMYTFGLYKCALKEFARVIRPKVGRVVLMTQDIRPLQEALVACKMWIERKSWPVECRGLRSRVYVLDIDVNWKYGQSQCTATAAKTSGSDVTGWSQAVGSDRGTPSMQQCLTFSEGAAEGRSSGRRKAKTACGVEERSGSSAKHGKEGKVPNVTGSKQDGASVKNEVAREAVVVKNKPGFAVREGENIVGGGNTQYDKEFSKKSPLGRYYAKLRRSANSESMKAVKSGPNGMEIITGQKDMGDATFFGKQSWAPI